MLGLIIGMGFAFGYMSHSQADDPTIGVLVNEPLIRTEDLEAFKSFNIDFSILEDERYKALETFGENPVDPGITGERMNPFLPLGQ